MLDQAWRRGGEAGNEPGALGEPPSPHGRTRHHHLCCLWPRYTPQQPAQRALCGPLAAARSPPRGVHSHTRSLGGAAEPALPLHVPAAQLLPPGRPCLSEPVSSSALEVRRAPSPRGWMVPGGSERLAHHGGGVPSGAPHSAQPSPARLRSAPISQSETLRHLLRFTES